MILLIDNYDSFTYNLYQMLAALHSEVRVVRNDKINLDEINELKATHIIISPGPGRPEDAGICVELIQALVSGDLTPTPLLGVCLGHQAIAVALGGKVVEAKKIVHAKSDLIFHQRQGLYKNLSMPFEAARYHSLIVDRETLAPELIVEAENSEQSIMGIRHKKLPIYGLQFHPESILTPHGNLILEAFVS